MTGESDQLYHDAALVQFYDLENGWAADTRYCVELAKDAASVLDLGCGTGLLAAHLGNGRRVVGVDPAAAMLDVARNRPGGDAVSWIEGDARTVRLNETFDLIVLTGHAFQVFLTEADQSAVLETIAAHLTTNGTFIFDSRNPASQEWREWTPYESIREIDHPGLGRIEAWNDVKRDEVTGVVTYETHYRALATGQTWSAASQIQFSAKADLDRLITAAGLRVQKWLGNWEGTAWDAISEEIIPVGGLA